MASRTISLHVGREPRFYTRSVTNAVSLADTRSAVKTSPPDPPSGSTLGGYSASNNSAALSQYGTPQIIRQYYGNGDNLPYPTGGWPTNTVWATSWKPYTGGTKAARNASLMEIAGGSKDALLIDMLNRFPARTGNDRFRIYLVDHEPDIKMAKDEMDAGPFAAAFNRFGQVLRNHPKADNFISVLGTGGYQPATRLPWLSGCDRGLFDVVAYDPYAQGLSDAQRKTYAGGRLLFSRWMPNFQQHFPGKRLAIGEFGTNFQVPFGNDDQLSEFIRGAYDFGRDNNYDHVCYFHNNANVIPANYPKSRAQLRIGSGN